MTPEPELKPELELKLEPEPEPELELRLKTQKARLSTYPERALILPIDLRIEHALTRRQIAQINHVQDLDQPFFRQLRVALANLLWVGELVVEGTEHCHRPVRCVAAVWL